MKATEVRCQRILKYFCAKGRIMKIARLAMVAVVLLGIGFWGRNTLGKAPKPAPLLKDQIVGVWKLDSRMVQKPDGSMLPYNGWDGAVGYIEYTRDGFMSVQFMQQNRTKQSPLGTYTAYFGPYSIDEASK